MFTLNNSKDGRFIRFKSLLNNVIEAGYQKFDDNRFGLSLDYDPLIDNKLTFSINLFKLYLECSISNEEKDTNFTNLSDVSTELEIDNKDIEFSETYEFEPAVSDFEKKARSLEISSKNEDTIKAVKNEIAEYGNIAVRHWVGVESGHDEPLSDQSLKIGQNLIIRGLNGATYRLDLRCDEDGWFIYNPFTLSLIDITFDEKRKLWVMHDFIE